MINLRSFLAFLFVFLQCSTIAIAQNSGSELFSEVDVMPRYSNCIGSIDEEEAKACTTKGLVHYLSSIKYPIKAKHDHLEGKVFVNFIVSKSGSIGNVAVGVSSGHDVLDSAAIDHIQRMPNWIPGMHEGKAVRVEYTVPMVFKIRNPEPIEDYSRKKKKNKEKRKK